MHIYLEIGQKRTFAGAIDWPGWCRSGKDESTALEALYSYGPRYARALSLGGIEFRVPGAVTEMQVVERLPGNQTTDFGAPDASPHQDGQPFDEAELVRSLGLLKGCWVALEAAAARAAGKTLHVGPRGGGRTLEDMLRHVLGSEEGYLSLLAWKVKKVEGEDLDQTFARIQEATLAALASAADGNLPERGPRGGKLWTPRYFVRRSAWHVLDHAWEIEDRVEA